MPVILKEKVKRYIKENYGKFSIHEVAKRYRVSQTDVEEYVIDELSQKMGDKKRKDKNTEESKQDIPIKWVNIILITLILISLATLIVALTIAPLSNNDVWQHLKNGQMILQTRRFQYVEPYSCNAAGKPWINEAWFSGVLFYIMYLIQGPNGIIYLKTLVILLMTALILINCYRLNTKFLLFFPFTVFMIFNVGVRFLARTEMFSYVFIASFFLILFQYKYRRIDKRILYLLPILQIIWSNMHGSFIVGVFIIAIFTGCETVRLLINRYKSFWQNDLLTWKKLKPLYIITVLTLIACIVNPYGLKLLAQPFHVVLQNRAYIKTIYEWQSPFESGTFRSSYAFRYYIIWMILLGLSFILDITRFDLSNGVLAAFFFTMAFKMHRNITIFTIATCPIMCLNIQQAFNDLVPFIKKKVRQAAVIGGMVFLLLIMIPLNFISFKNGYIYRENSSKPFGLGVASNMPIKATEYIKANHIKGCCFNTYTYGTYLIFHCFPDTRVTMDSRAEHVYGEKFYRRHQASLYDLEIFKEILEEFNIEYILIKYETGELINHSKYLRESGEWALVYFDKQCFLYVRRLPEYKQLTERDEYKYLHPLLTPEETKIPEKLVDDYIKESERNLSYNPDFILVHIVLLNLYNARKIWTKVVEHGEYLLSMNHKNYSMFLIMGNAYANLNEIEKAREMYKIALSLNPRSNEIKRALERL